MLELIKELCGLDGVSGSEDAVRAFIAARVAPHAESVETDVMGNLIVRKKGAVTPKKSLMLCAHMDEVGLIVTSITDDGYLKFGTVGGIDRRVLLGKTVRIGDKAVPGVIGCKAIHLFKKDEREKIPTLDELYIDIGAASKSDAEALVALGDVCAFDSQWLEFGDGFVKAKALDDRAGCAILIKLIESDLPVDCTFVFTVQEEVGTRGAYTAAFKVAPDVALVIENTTAADLPSVPSAKKTCAVGKGVVIPFMDGRTIYSRELYAVLTSLADKNNITWQTKTYVSGGTDAGTIQRARDGVLTAGIAAPVRNLHSPANVASVADLEAVYKLAKLFVNEAGALL